MKKILIFSFATLLSLNLLGEDETASVTNKTVNVEDQSDGSVDPVAAPADQAVQSPDQSVNEADQKWLAAAVKMIINGQQQISTPLQARTQLLLNWAKKNAYAIQIQRTEVAFHIELKKEVAKN